MASGAQQQHHHKSQLLPQSTQQHEHLMQQQQQQQQQHQQPQQQQQMQFAPQNHIVGLRQASFDPQQQVHQQHNAMSPIMTSMPVNHTQSHGISINPQQQQQSQLMRPVVGSPIMNQVPCNQSSSHIQLQQSQQQQKSQILPLLLSPRPPSLKSNSLDRSNEQSENDHDQIIDQVISLENDYSDSSAMLTSVDDASGIILSHQQQSQQQQQQQQTDCRSRQQQQQQHLMGDIDLGSGICVTDSNQLSSSSEDLLNLLLEFDREPSNLIGLDTDQQDEKVGIETIRKQLMSCEVQSDQNQQNTNSMSIVNQMTCQPQQQSVTQQQHGASTTSTTVHQQQLVSQSSPVISHHQQSHQIPTSGPSQMSTDQAMLHGTYSNVSMSPVPVSSSGQPFANQHVARISQSNPMSIVSNSPSPSWQQPQLSPYSSQNPHNNPRTPTQRQGQQHHTVHPMQQQQQHQTSTTSIQMQQIHNPLQQTRSPSLSVSPPATTEPSPVVKKNPLLNAQLINSRAPSITPTRFMNNQTNVLNQNPILNAKLSQSPFVTNSCGTVSSPGNSNLNSQSRFIQQNQQTTNFNFDITQQRQQQQQQQQQNAQQQQSGHIPHYGHTDQQSSANQIFRTATTTATSLNAGSIGTPVSMGNTSPSGGSSQQVKQEIRRKVQQPKQQHQTTSLLKQLLSDDNK